MFWLSWSCWLVSVGLGFLGCLVDLGFLGYLGCLGCGDMHLRFTLSPDLGRTWSDSRIVVPSVDRRSAWGPVLHYNGWVGQWVGA